jgi:hypothetical protein
MTAGFSIALLHYPVYDKNRQVVTTAVTNLDIHDIARAARTYGAYRYFVVTPVAEQQALVTRVADHWRQGWGATYNPKRKAALEILRVAPDLTSVIEELSREHGHPPRIVATGAGQQGTLTVAGLAGLMSRSSDHFLLLFGTGWGLTEEAFARAELTLAPLSGGGDYNHLSVRSAVSIYLDRLRGRTEEEQ